MKWTEGVILAGLAIASFAAPVAQAADAKSILDATGVQGGLVVHLGCGSGKLTAALRADERYVVQGLDKDRSDVEKAREHIRSLGLYGPVSVSHWEGRTLPYVDNLINLVVAEDTGVPMNEITRVLAPRGVAYMRKNGTWNKTVKPWPREIDEWTHYLHGPDNNAVAQDSKVAPPRHMHWKGKPMWCRSHEFNSSVAAMVSGGGRVFYILDEGITGLTDKRFPPKWALIARDAFNGVMLWKRPMKEWGWRAWNKAGFRGNPLVLPRRLVALHDKVYVTFSYHGPLMILDAATGRTIRACKETANTFEIVSTPEVMVLRLKDSAGQDSGDSLAAVNPHTGDIVWKKRAEKMVPLSLAVKDGRICYHNYAGIACRDLKTGEQLWHAPCPSGGRGRSQGTMIMYGGAVVFTGPRNLRAFSAATGQELWKGPRVRGVGAAQPSDLFGVDGLLWPAGPKVNGYDPMTGEVKKTVGTSQLISPGHHYRCHRSKATQRYLLLPKRGVEFLDLKGTDHMRHDWLRAPCSYGVMPCNGMLYVAPHQCFCYPGVKLSGFNVLSGSVEDARQEAKGTEAERLVHGPAWGEASDPRSEIANPQPEDWPTYRHDPRRSGKAGSVLPADLKRLWASELGGRLSPPVVAGGRLFLAEIDAHTVRCLDARSGKPLWSYTAGARVDSPPTIHKGLVLFGSTDGWAYCLRASDGKLVWRFRAAPKERRVSIFGQPESAWPVHGSILVQKGIAYFTAGRSSFLDGGIYVYAVEPATGKVLHETRLESKRPDARKDKGRPFDMEGTRSDILVSDGRDLYMYQERFGPDLTRRATKRLTGLGDREMGLHLITTQGFLDNSWFNRTYWSYSRRWPGFYFAYNGPKAGQILVFDDTTTYGVHVFTERLTWSPDFRPGAEGYKLFADDNANEPVLSRKRNKNPHEVGRGRAAGYNVEKGPGYSRARPPKWLVKVPVRIKAMVLAGEHLGIAGPPDEVPADDPLAAFEGRRGAQLWIVSAANGQKLAEYGLDRMPVFDGMIAARGRLYLTTEDGLVICMAKK